MQCRGLCPLAEVVDDQYPRPNGSDKPLCCRHVKAKGESPAVAAMLKLASARWGNVLITDGPLNIRHDVCM